MQIQRTANAGILLELDGKRMLLDGVCQGVGPYLPTPASIQTMLLQQSPGALIFTHSHPDHYDGLFVAHYMQNTAGPVLGPADIPWANPDAFRLDTIQITPIPTRHIGKADNCAHHSYVVQGSRCLWFLGDASLLDWQKNADVPKPDVIVAPFGFLIGRGWAYCKSLGVKTVVVVHMPLRENDPYGLWQQLEQTLDDSSGVQVLIPEIGQSITV